MASSSVVVASRLHWNNHARDAAIDVGKALSEAMAFYRRAATYGAAVVLAIGVPSPVLSDPPGSDAFVRSVASFLTQLQREIDSLAPSATPFRLVALTFWGQFVPALNAAISTAATHFPDACYVLFQSLEIQVPASGVSHLQSHFIRGEDLVVGAALPGHAFRPEASQPQPLDGVTTPWNTLALWDLTQLAKIGFPLVGDGLGLPSGVAGVEEVSTIALYQRVYPSQSRAKVVQVPGLAWHVDEFQDEERRAWQQRKMDSKKARPAQQMAHLQLPTGHVYHL